MSNYISDNAYDKNKKISEKKNSSIINYILTDPILSEDASAYASFKCQAPHKSFERNYEKKLKLVTLICKNVNIKLNLKYF
jgi:hypothetical protein